MMKSGEMETAREVMKDLGEECIDSGVDELMDLGREILNAL